MDGFDASEAIESGGGEDKRITITLFQFAKTRINVAANFDKGNVWSKGKNLSSAAGTGSSNAATCGESVERPILLADPHIACIGAPGDGCKGELGSEFGWEIFEGVDGEIDATHFKRFFNFFDEDALAVKIWRRNEAGLLHAVAGGADDFDLGWMARAAQGFEDVVRLPQGELGAPAADTNGAVWMDKL